jgi:uncharacterized protein
MDRGVEGVKVGRTSFLGLIFGLAGGFFGGLAGLGGGVIMIPLMTIFGGLSQKQAHGTSLVAVVFTGAIGALTYFSHGVVDWKAAVILAASAMLFARMGALYAHRLPESRLKKGFGIFIMCVSLLLVVRGLLPASTGGLSFWMQAIVLLLTGVGTGFVSGMMGVGGGSVMIPAMVILAGMPQHLAQGTSLLAMIPVGITGAFTHYKLGNVQTSLVLGLVAGAIVGGFFGGTVANLLPEIYMKVIFAIIGVIMGVKYLRG